MRSVFTSVLALGLSVALCASAQAAPSHQAKVRHTNVHYGRDAVPGFAAPAKTVDPRFPPVLEDQTPRYDDPSKFGGG
jgi:hypothetical protein